MRALRGRMPRTTRLDHGLAGARFADQPEHAPGSTASETPRKIALTVDGNPQILHAQQRAHRPLTGSSASRKPSPSAFMPSTAAITHSMGNASSHHA